MAGPPDGLDGEAMTTERLKLRYVKLETVERFEDNPKLHDLDALCESFRRYGFVDPPKYDASLEAIVYGNGRAEALEKMRVGGEDPPRGIAVDGRSGAWLVPVVFGIDADSRKAAESLAVDHNSSTLGPGFDAADAALLFDSRLIESLADGWGEDHELTVDFLHPQPGSFVVERVKVSSLRPHPENYQTHPEDQLEHLIQSIRDHGVYRNIVTASDGVTIVAGHGVYQALSRLEIEWTKIRRLSLAADDPLVVKVMIGDNEVSHLGVRDDRALTELLRSLSGDLIGTGYDSNMLANLTFVTRSSAEIQTMDAAQEWADAGMPEYQDATPRVKLTVTFLSETYREQFVKEHNLRIDKKEAKTWSTRWPFTEREDLAALRYESERGGGP